MITEQYTVANYWLLLPVEMPMPSRVLRELIYIYLDSLLFWLYGTDLGKWFLISF